MNSSIYVMILVLIGTITSISYLLNSKLVNPNDAQKVASKFLVFFICNTLYLILSTVLFSKFHYMSFSAPFAVFYGPFLFLLIESFKRRQYGITKSKVNLLIHFIIPIFFFTIYIVGMFVNAQYSQDFVKSYFISKNLASVFLIVVYGLYCYNTLLHLDLLYAVKIMVLRLIFLLVVLAMVILGMAIYDVDYSDYSDLVVCWMLLFSIFSLNYYVGKVKEIELLGDKHVVHANKSLVTPASTMVDNAITEYNLREFNLETKVDLPSKNEDITEHKYIKSKLSDEVLLEYNDRIQRVLLDEQGYLEVDFSVDDLSQRSDVAKHHIAQVFSLLYQSNFSTYVNSLRISHATTLIVQNRERLNVNALVEECGFNSRTSFFRAFKKFTSQSPSQYYKNHKE